MIFHLFVISLCLLHFNPVKEGAVGIPEITSIVRANVPMYQMQQCVDLYHGSWLWTGLSFSRAVGFAMSKVTCNARERFDGKPNRGEEQTNQSFPSHSVVRLSDLQTNFAGKKCQI